MRKPPKLKTIVTPIPSGQHCHTVEQCKQALGVADSTMWAIIASGKLKSFKAGRRRLVTADSFAAYQRGES
ncbi:helix-turn-helix domain-containing protein [Bradyrhizobium daqingense]|uniref:helix-turn-helix domain-containing protein n=1 Tax=Bradyrhizobium daqingense TaxID=993502 RepID=UPI00119EDEC2